MIHSMTGFARTQQSGTWGNLSWEIRSVNHRYLETYWRLPDEFRSLETELRSIASSKLTRGKLDCQLQFKRGNAGGEQFQVNTQLAAQVMHAARDLTEALPNTAAINPIDILSWPGVVNEGALDFEPIREQAKTAFSDAIDQLKQSRKDEGERIKAMLDPRLDSLADWVTQARNTLPDIKAVMRERLEQRLADIDVSADPGRLEQELTIQATKMDVDEEMDRLEAHIAEVRKQLTRKDPVGRRLDFLMQEMNREANTLGSKSQHLGTTQVAVESKVLIEQMREQIQNIE